MPTTSNFGWTTPADTDLVKDGAAAIRTLGNGIDTSLVDLKGGTTGQVLSKNSNTDLDYTWVTPNVGDITEVQAGTGISVASGTGPIPVVTNTVATAFDAKGDLVVGTGADTFAKLTVGTNGHTLVADSATATGLKWAAPSSPSFVGCGLYATNVSVSFTQNATSKIPFAAEDFDTDAFHDNSTNNTRITIPSGRGGKYLLTAFLRCTPANYGQLSILKNNAGIVNGINGPWVEQAGIGSYTTTFSNSIIVDAVATDYYEISFQSDWATGSKSIWSYFQAQYLGA